MEILLHVIVEVFLAASDELVVGSVVVPEGFGGPEGGAGAADDYAAVCRDVSVLGYGMWRGCG